VLGGQEPISVETFTDMSHNTGPNGKSVIAYGTRLGKNSGLISAKATATVDVILSSFEGELDGTHQAVNCQASEKAMHLEGMLESFKANASTCNIMAELNQYPTHRSIFSDNEAMIDFVNGEAQGKGVKHAQLRLHYVRQQLDRGVELFWMSGKEILANPMTKAVYEEEQIRHAREVQGVLLLD